MADFLHNLLSRLSKQQGTLVDNTCTAISFWFTTEMLPSTLLFWFLLFSEIQTGISTFSDYRAPMIDVEPPSKLTFLNTSGASLHCSASGNPIPDVYWIITDGTKVTDLPGLRVSMSNGTLLFPPFHSENYRQDVHSTLYRCVASNSLGKVGSRDVQVRAVLEQDYAAQIHDEIVVRGNTAVLYCHLPNYVKEFVKVTSWEREDGVTIKSNVASGGRYSVLANGELHIRETVLSDGFQFYRCRTRHELSREDSRLSMSHGRLIVLDAKEKQAPRLSDTRISVHVQEGEPVELTCAAQGYPLPSYRWYKNEGGRLVSVVVGRRVIQVSGSLYFRDTSIRDTGSYTCVVINSVGERRMDSTLIVTDGERLPTNKRQRLFRNASLTISNIQKAEDEGTYSCTAKNRDGATAKGSVKVTVQEKPVILPFNFPKEIQQGMKIRLFCTVAAGDPPFQLSWFKDGQPLLPGRSDVIINTPGEDYSSLIIESATPEHNGQYTCSAKNDAALVNYTSTLVVRVPPRWRIKPSDVSVIAGKSVTLHCQAEGYPQPRVVWERKTASMVSGYQHISTSYHYQIFENGSLTIEGVTEQDAGFYLCQATNGIGPEMSTVVNVSVHIAPQFHTKFRTQMAQKGETVTINCQVTGDLPISVVWLRDQRALDVDLESRIEEKEIVKTRGMESQLQITSTSRIDSSLYTCRASNSYGSDETNVQLIVQEPPDPPQEIKLLKSGSRNVVITWSSPFSGNSVILNYTVQWRSKSVSPAIWRVRTVPANETSFIIHNLKPAQTYEVRMLAGNIMGISHPGNTFTFSTEEEIPESPPDGIRVEAFKPQSLHVSWKPLAEELSNGVIQGYYIGYKITNSTDSFQYKTVKNESLGRSRVECELYGLKKYTSYTVVVQAFNRKGAGPRSDPVIGRTREDVPSFPPKQPNCTPLTSQSIKVTWLSPPPESLNGVLKGYKVKFGRSNEFNEPHTQDVTIGSDRLMVILRGLDKFCNYTITVLAFTREGDGKPSEPFFCRTLGDVPSPPADIKATPMLPDAILVSWRPPSNPNGVIQNYTLYQRSSTGVTKNTVKMTVPSTQRYYEAHKLPQNRRFEFWVTASTEYGESKATRVLSQTTSASVPARIASFSENILVTKESSVELPCQAVGIPDPDRKWSFRGQPIVERGSRVRILLNGSLYIPHVQDGDAGNYTCRVQNSYGADEIGFGIIVKGVFQAPNLTVIAVTTSTIQVKWEIDTRPHYNVKGYLLSYRRQYASWEEVEIRSDRKTATLKNLKCGTRYLLRIAAFSHTSTGEYSKPIYGRTEGKSPQAPAKTTFITANSTFLILHKNAWNDGHCPIRSFIVRYKRFFATDWTLTNSDTKSHVIIRNLSPGTWYKVWVTSHNDAGSTVAEYQVATLKLDGATVAPLSYESSQAPPNLWEDLNIIIPIVAAVVALSVVIGVAVCVCLKKRQGDETYERRRANENTLALVPPSGPKKYSDTVQHQETPIYQSIPKIQTHLPAPASENLVHDCQRQFYEDELTPYATFRLPGCDSDTESSQGTVREFQTFGNQYERSFPDPSAQEEDQTGQSEKIDNLPKRSGYRIFDITNTHKLSASRFWEDYQSPQGSIIQVINDTFKQISNPNEPSRFRTNLEDRRKMEKNYVLVTRSLEERLHQRLLGVGTINWENTKC
ncbi:Down syndrome cell adhesion molecule-like protein Dscam2 [Limulus polyphemus]|uniref:Down syndrome cell adhesion molecule-like protein Dscam2 n=1 Tax=Limulus polyphemus TaxID=6850 RepID=A0ABM1TA86_LIMPO|nr:Down syndrome cell adhesion molecule-like protein Dscam2 [Limulus polyphemus]